MRKPPGTLGLKKFGPGKIWVENVLFQNTCILAFLHTFVLISGNPTKTQSIFLLIFSLNYIILRKQILVFAPIFLGQKNYFGQKSSLGQKVYWVKKVFGSKQFFLGQTSLFGQKNVFWVKKSFLGQKKFVGSFWVKKKFVKKFLG